MKSSLLALILLAVSTCAAEPDWTVDHRYSIPWWQTASCAPDDADKPLVGKEGQFFFDYGQKGPRHFGISISASADPEPTWQKQQTVSPRIPIVQTFKKAGPIEILEEAFLVPPTNEASAINPTTRPATLPPRLNLITLQLTNTSDKPANYFPIIAIDTIHEFEFDPDSADNVGIFSIGPSTHLAVSHAINCSSSTGIRKRIIYLVPVVLAPGQSQTVVLAIYRNYSKDIVAITPERAAELRKAAVKFWTDADLPYAAVSLPDPAIQGMFDSSIRNIYQAREIKKGLPAFHVGPTCYRGLWVVDGSFILEAITMLGRPAETRAGIEYLMSFQKPDGRFEIIPKFWKENGIVPWAVTRHAMLTQDKPWLQKQWPSLKRTIAFMQTLRQQTMTDPNRPDYGLLPPGDVDGGISNAGANAQPEFSNSEWCLGGLKSAIAAAHWLGDEESAAAWQKEYDVFYAAFIKAAHRDMRKDSHDNSYLPTMILNQGNHSPQKGQWGFLHAVYPGQVFSKDSPLVASQLAMLRATKTQGLVFDTGWMKNGIWTYAASFYGHALLWQGEGREAAGVLYDYANHAAPTRVWREEQKPFGQKSEEVGDMPHNWASAEFIRLTLHLLELDRGDELHLLEGLPRPWASAGKTTKLTGVLTPFGPLTLKLTIAPDVKTASLTVNPLTRKPSKIVVHLDGLTGKPGVMEIEQKAEGTTTTIPLQ